MRWSPEVALRLVAVVAISSLYAMAETPENLPSQPIGKQDLVSITVYNAPEFSKTLRVSDTGDIEIPMLKHRVHAAGLLPTDLGKAICSELETEGLLVRPSVTVTVAEYRSRAITVVGAVRKPVTFQQLGRVTLSEAITHAEGTLPDAGGEILIARAPDMEGSPRPVERVSVRALLEGHGGDLQLNAGDEVRVPVAEKIFVVGNVRRPGAFRADDAATTSVMSMLALSEGLLPYTNRTAYVYRNGRNGREEIAVPLRDILQRKAPDPALFAGDIFYVPDNRGRRLTLSTLDRIINFGAYTTSGILIWGR